jgi:hypothetical protein
MGDSEVRKAVRLNLGPASLNLSFSPKVQLAFQGLVPGESCVSTSKRVSQLLALTRFYE